MAFRFSLQAVLRFRHSLEHHELMLLQSANQKVTAVQGEINAFEQCLQERAQAQQRGLVEQSFGAELHFNGLCTTTLENCKHALEKELAQLEKLRDLQYEVFRQARMQREIVESIRDSQMREYRIRKDRKEQRSLDDQFLSRREFLRREPQ